MWQKLPPLTEDVSFGTSSLLAHKHVFLQATINMKPNIQNFLPSQKSLFEIKIYPKILFLVFYKSMIALQVLFCLVLLSVQQHRKDQLLNKKCAWNFFWETPHLPLWSHIFFPGALNSVYHRRFIFLKIIWLSCICLYWLDAIPRPLF